MRTLSLPPACTVQLLFFPNDVNRVSRLIQAGVVIKDELILVSSLSSPSKKIVLSNVLPFISDVSISKELSRYERVVSSPWL